MAFNLLTKKRTGRDWSICVGDDAERDLSERKTHPLAAIGVALVGGIIIGAIGGYQYCTIQSQYPRTKK